MRDLSETTVEKRWVTSVLAGLLLPIVIVYIVVRHVLNGFSAMAAREYVVVLASALVITVFGFIAFIDFFAVDLTVRVRKTVSISKKAMMQRKERHDAG